MTGKQDEGTHLYDSRSGGKALRFTDLRVEESLFEPGPDSLLFAVPYQYLRFAPDRPVTGEVIEFHASFQCVETFHAESGCSGRLFNDPYGVPVLESA